MQEFHTFEKDIVLQSLQSDAQSGLSPAEAQIRLSQQGYNELQEKKQHAAWLMFLLQFKDFMIVILLLAAVVSAFIGDLTDTFIILVIVILNSLIGFVQEFRTEKAIAALKKMSVVNAHIIRGGQHLQIPSQQLVPGDVVLLEAGNAVPADLRLLETHSLKVDESALTGESVAVDKSPHTLEGPEIPLGDRLNMAYKGTLITNGRAKGIVVATGMQTELGKIASLLQEDDADTPLKKRMAAFGKNLTYMILMICVIIFAAGWLRGEDPFKMLLLGISLAVAAIPEALPALMTVALAMGANRMAKQQALVRKLPAVETLGSVSYICSDKTGTLTLNKMTLTDLYELPHSDTGVENPLQIALALNHDIQFQEGVAVGEATELAIVNHVHQQLGQAAYVQLQAAYPRVGELPFDSDRKCMTTVHQFQGKYWIISKGAPESIIRTLADDTQKEQIRQRAEEWANNGLRVLAYAYKLMDELPEPFTYQTLEQGLTALGLVALIDPPREEVKTAIQECKQAGIQAVMITGDHPATALAIAKEIGIYKKGDEMLTGESLQRLDDETFLAQVERTTVYARVSPEQKLRIVKALQQKNQFVAMTGDGVNDAPSLNAANIGIAMGINGTDVSKEAAKMVLLDDNFATIVKAVKEGRRIYDNIRKFVRYIMTCNSAEIWIIFLAPLVGLPMPLLPIHILWINLVTDGLPGLALASERTEKDVMQRKPRPANEPIFADGLGLHILWVGLLMAGLTLGVQAWSYFHDNAHWQTMVFTTLALLQLGHAIAVRSERNFLFTQGLFSNMPLLLSVCLTFLFQLVVIYVPFMNSMFRTQPLDWDELAICIGLAAVLFHAVEFEKWLREKLAARAVGE